MTADINSEHLFFKCKELVLFKLFNRRKRNFHVLLLFLASHVKNRHLPFYLALLVFGNAVHQYLINLHVLPAISA